MSGELGDFKEGLRRELVAAAYRQRAAARQPVPVARRSWRLSPIAGLAVAALVVAAGVMGASLLIPADPVAADVFAITVIDDEVELAVIDIIVDPEAVTRQLADELGVDAELRAVPTPPALIGQIVVTATFEGRVEPEVEHDENGVIDRIALPAGFSGTLYIEYGRDAEPGEVYKATITDVACAELWGLTPGEAAPRLNDLATQVYYEAIDGDNANTARVALDDIDSSYRLIDVVYLNQETLVVTYAADPDEQPRHTNCRPAGG
jgi:hypothetical protein